MPDFLQLDGVTPLEEFLDSIRIFLLDLEKLQNNPAYDPERILSKEELSRADKFATRELRNRFVSRRWILRKILSEFCDEQPHSLQIHTGKYGKPYLAGEPVQFSFSHTQNNAVIAIAYTGSVGIDIETLPSTETCTEVADRLLTQNEDIQHLRALDEEYRLAFLRYWTLKEAIIKASGEGLSRDLKEIQFEQISPAPVLSRIPLSYGDKSEWKLHAVYLEMRHCMVATAHRN